MGLENSEFQAKVWDSGRERTGIYQSRPGSTERSVQFIIGTDCVINRKISNHFSQTKPTIAEQPCPLNKPVYVWEKFMQ